MCSVIFFFPLVPVLTSVEDLHYRVFVCSPVARIQPASPTPVDNADITVVSDISVRPDLWSDMLHWGAHILRYGGSYCTY